jgi:hypothetical protein
MIDLDTIMMIYLVIVVITAAIVTNKDRPMKEDVASTESRVKRKKNGDDGKGWMEVYGKVKRKEKDVGQKTGIATNMVYTLLGYIGMKDLIHTDHDKQPPSKEVLARRWCNKKRGWVYEMREIPIHCPLPPLKSYPIPSFSSEYNE